MPPSPLVDKSPNESRLFNHEGEKRRNSRHSADDLSQILFGNQMIGCRVHNLSKNGAMIEVSISQVPDRFILVNFRTKQRMVCEVIWREHLNLGVRFTTIPKSFSDGFK